MGAEENIEIANKYIEQGTKNGSWILIKNIHVAIGWLTQFEKVWENQRLHKNTRLFLVSEFTEKIPRGIVKNSLKIVYEFSEGIVDSMY